MQHSAAVQPLSEATQAIVSGLGFRLDPRGQVKVAQVSNAVGVLFFKEGENEECVDTTKCNQQPCTYV